MSIVAEYRSPSSVSFGSTDGSAALLVTSFPDGIEENGVQRDEVDELKEQQRLKKHRLVYESTADLRSASVEISKQQETSGSTSELVKETCLHPSLIRNLCAYCGTFVEEGAGSYTAFGYIHKDLRLSASEVERYRKFVVKNLLGEKKLILVLDLDHTLLNSTAIVHLKPEENNLLQQADAGKDDLFKLAKSPMLTKLRPFVRTFLKEAQDMFEMYIYTLGMKWYAHALVELIDPEEKYFSSKVISRCDCTTQNKKGLDVVLGDDKVVIILDDTESVWEKHRDNLIVMERYHYFASSVRKFGAGKYYSERNEDESEADGVLASILNVLKRAHAMFFDPGSESNFCERDARQVLRSLRKEILHGCKIVFSRLIPWSERAEEHYIWKLAEELGATCSCEVDSSVTHVVAAVCGTDKTFWAQENGKYLVNSGWLEAAGRLWKRQREQDFVVPPDPRIKKNTEKDFVVVPEKKRQQDFVVVPEKNKEQDFVVVPEKKREHDFVVVPEKKREQDVLVPEKKREQDFVVVPEKKREQDFVVVPEKKREQDVLVPEKKREQDFVVVPEKKREQDVLVPEKNKEQDFVVVPEKKREQDFVVVLEKKREQDVLVPEKNKEQDFVVVPEKKREQDFVVVPEKKREQDVLVPEKKREQDFVVVPEKKREQDVSVPDPEETGKKREEGFMVPDPEETEKKREKDFKVPDPEETEKSGKS